MRKLVVTPHKPQMGFFELYNPDCILKEIDRSKWHPPDLAATSRVEVDTEDPERTVNSAGSESLGKVDPLNYPLAQQATSNNSLTRI